MIRTGRWQDVLADVTSCHSVITDPPYGESTHADARSSTGEEGISYAHFTDADVKQFVAYWTQRATRWIVALTSHDLIPSYFDAYRFAGWYSFAPVPVATKNPAPRMACDGPTNSCVYAMVARPKTREALAWRSLPGHYVVPVALGGQGRGKPLELCSALVRDYSNPGDLIVDPFAGLGGIPMAAIGMRRHAIGAEMDAEIAAEANSRRAQLALMEDAL